MTAKLSPLLWARYELAVLHQHYELGVISREEFKRQRAYIEAAIEHHERPELRRLPPQTG
jgi:hypothetical protein